MSILARFENRPERRGAARRLMRLDIEAGDRLPTGTEIIVHDLSLTGALLETSGFHLPEVFDVQLPGEKSARATVVWSSGNLYGCQFTEALSPATLSAALLRSSPKTEEPRRPGSVELLRQLKQVRAQVEGLVDQVDRAIENLKKH